MSKLDELIAELCPDGVEYIPLKQIAEVGTGSSDRVNAVDDGEYPFYVRSKTVFRSNRYLFDEEAIVIPGEGGIGDIFHYVNGKYDLHQRAYRIHFKDKEEVNTKYAYYYFAANFKKFIMMKAVNATVTSIRKPMIENFLLPLPPLPVQQEIVRILDKFTELTAELTVELTARKKQYEYYRDLLLTFDDDRKRKLAVQWLTIGEVCDLSAGGDVPKDRYSKEKTYKYNVPILSNGIGDNALYGYTDVAKINQPCVTVAARGTIGYCALRENPFYPVVRLICAIPHNMVNVRYLYYVMQTLNFQIPTSGIPQLTVPMLAKYKIPVPPLEEQERIVAILDRFDALCNDLTSGLPAEIEARRKQYEYYRDKLLTFPARPASQSGRREGGKEKTA
ncbi:MAG: restriction endonuclease subunit S [Methanomethylovorans sp.]|nr:restriction endonuclease subunit S [Methanomethylovorans sp.]